MKIKVIDSDGNIVNELTFRMAFETEDDFLTFIHENTSFTSTEEDAFSKYIYAILKREFYNEELLFDTVDEFKQCFINLYEQVFLKLQTRKSIIEKSYELTENDYLEYNKIITNLSENDNSYPDDVNKPLSFITTQNYNLQLSNKLQSYIYAVNNILELDNKVIKDIFRGLFNYIQSGEVMYFYE